MVYFTIKAGLSMNAKTSVLERNVLQPGKSFIREGEENARAYVVQNGEIAAYKKLDDRKIEVATYGPGTIIGEINLMIDEPAKLSYEALTTTTVVTITRQDFQKRLVRTDKSIQTILDHAVKKIVYYENLEIQKALKNAEVDDTAVLLVKGLLSGMSEDKKSVYEEALFPHINNLLKDIKSLKKREKERKKEKK